jgi:hypothetical protein
MKNILLMTVLLGLIIVGLTACSEDPRMNPDQIITKDSFNEAMIKQCDESWRCVRREVIVPKIEKHCSQNKLTPVQCEDLTYKVDLKVNEYLSQYTEMIRGLSDKLKEATEELKDQKRQQERREK